MARVDFHWDDPLLLDRQLSDEERMIRDAARDYAQGQLAPRVVEAFRNERTDPDIFKEMGALGLLGATIPERFGGGGLNYVSYGLIAREVERVDSGYRSMMSVQSSLVMLPIDRFGTEAQKQKYLPALARGDAVGCFGLTEPDHGSDPGSMITRRAQRPRRLPRVGREDMDFQRPPSPTYSSSGRRPTTISSADSSSRKAGRAWKRRCCTAKWGLRASVTGQILMDDVFVPEENLLPGVTGLKGPFTCLDSAGTASPGARWARAESCWHTARQYVLDRRQFGRPLAANQLIQKKLADMQTEITLACRGVCGSGA